MFGTSETRCTSVGILGLQPGEDVNEHEARKLLRQRKAAAPVAPADGGQGSLL